MKNAIIYLRNSTEEDLSKYEAPCLEYCERQGLNVVAIYRDPVTSGRKVPFLEREAGAKAYGHFPRCLPRVEPAEPHATHLVAYSLDRLFRDGMDGAVMLGRFQERGVTVHLVDEGGMSADTSSSSGFIMMWIKLGFAQYEAMRTAERTRDVLLTKAAAGQRISGQAPYGYRFCGKKKKEVEVDEEEQANIREMVRLREEEGWTNNRIAVELGRQGRKPRGVRWRHELVGKCLAEAGVGE